MPVANRKLAFPLALALTISALVLIAIASARTDSGRSVRSTDQPVASRAVQVGSAGTAASLADPDVPRMELVIQSFV